jgi:hypothetical protein
MLGNQKHFVANHVVTEFFSIATRLMIENFQLS